MGEDPWALVTTHDHGRRPVTIGGHPWPLSTPLVILPLQHSYYSGTPTRHKGLDVTHDGMGKAVGSFVPMLLNGSRVKKG